MNENEKNVTIKSILELCSPVCVILYGAKRGLSSGKLKTANICIVIHDIDKNKLLHKLYLQMPLDIQVNIKIYTTDEWNQLQQDPNSYAAWISEKGAVLYESKS